MPQLIPSTTSERVFKDHGGDISGVAVFPDRRRMVTCSRDKALRLWDLNTGAMLKKMEGHPSNEVLELAVSRDGQLIASGDDKGEVIIWHGETGESITQPIKAHFDWISSLNFSPNGEVLITGASSDNSAKLWSTQTWRMQGKPIQCDDWVRCVRYSPSGKLLAISAQGNIEIYHSGTRERVACIKGKGFIFPVPLVWTPDGTSLLSGGDHPDPTIREWDTSTWKQVGDPWTGHTDDICAIAIDSTGTLVASASCDRHVRLWRLSDRETIAVFQHPTSCNAFILNAAICVTFSMDGKHVLSGGDDRMISEWAVPKDNSQEASKAQVSEAIEALQMTVFKLNSAVDTQIRKLRKEHLKQSEAEGFIRQVIDVQLDTAPLRLLNTTTGLLCDREAQIRAFKRTAGYEKLLSLTMKHSDLRMERITEAVGLYFCCAMLSHRWEGKEPALEDIQDKIVYHLRASAGFKKLQSFCKKARQAGFHWAWVDSCCVDQHNHVELQKSLNSMFTWYRHAALTIVYLSDVPSSSKSGALAESAWNTRGWTVPEFLAPKAVRFYQQDWTPYLHDDSPNHKESVEIMRELEYATGIEARALVTFQPGMRDAREKLRWASTRVTTEPEDIAYSLFGIFSIQLPILYGENRQNALGRLPQEIVARSGDITALDWVGQPSEFNSCLPFHISSYTALPCALPYLSEDEIQIAVSSLRHTVAVDLASELYDWLDNMSAPRFANCRLHLPCIVFRVTEVRRRPGPAQETFFTYGVKAEGLYDLQITTEDKLMQFSHLRPTRRAFLLVRPWDRRLLELPDFPDDADCLGGWSELESPLDDSDESPCGSPGEEELADSESLSRALRLIVRLGQPFGAFLLAQQRGGEYKRIASDHNITAEVKDVASVRTMMDIRTLEIL